MSNFKENSAIDSDYKTIPHKKHTKVNNWRICPQCNIEAIETNEVAEFFLICPVCGLEIENLSNTSTNYNKQYSNSGGNQTKIDGDNTYSLNKALHGSTADRDSSYIYHAMNKLNAINSQMGNKIPPYILDNVVQEYNNIRRNNITRRGGAAKSIQAAILWHICAQHNIPITRKILTDFFNINSREQSKGDSIVRQLVEDGILNIKLDQTNNSSFINCDLRRINIDIKWAQVVQKIIDKAHKLQLFLRSASSPNMKTKRIGAIYYLINEIEELNTEENMKLFKKYCDISRSTYMHVYRILKKNEQKIKKIWKSFPFININGKTNSISARKCRQ